MLQSKISMTRFFGMNWFYVLRHERQATYLLTSFYLSRIIWYLIIKNEQVDKNVFFFLGTKFQELMVIHPMKFHIQI